MSAGWSVSLRFFAWSFQVDAHRLAQSPDMVVLSYVYAHLKGDTLQQDPHMKRKIPCSPCSGLSSLENSIHNTRTTEMEKDIIILTPTEPVCWLSSNTFWSRELPTVQYFTVFWNVWEDEEIPESVACSSAKDVSAFVVPRSQYDQLDEKCKPDSPDDEDKLTDLVKVFQHSVRLAEAASPPSDGTKMLNFAGQQETAFAQQPSLLQSQPTP
ncbi:hypothetical protein BDN71DRAFT_1513711 [Pleurotus eryngii]|uniref:Uncharacterized protein n=1 Tax=Pleurotus eryngii TaxID=5323 RepID=A0A9P5ZHV7_PLEER|nr:hypothetical protein BDN71DRAFT_1513711 [Pleurotus eryngii]